eukprot:SAG11_NODE_9498_length_906_cov_1.861214_1_plen_64_part_00
MRGILVLAGFLCALGGAYASEGAWIDGVQGGDEDGGANDEEPELDQAELDLAFFRASAVRLRS